MIQEEEYKARIWQQGWDACEATYKPVAFKDELPRAGLRIVMIAKGLSNCDNFSIEFFNEKTGEYSPRGFSFTHWLPVPSI